MVDQVAALMKVEPLARALLVKALLGLLVQRVQTQRLAAAVVALVL
jgi:beta-lactamase regulating signal transducer with metallopeptidase domain